MRIRGTRWQGYSEERERKLEQIELKAMRKTYDNPNMSLQEMKEMLRPKKNKGGSTIDVTFLKNTKEE